MKLCSHYAGCPKIHLHLSHDVSFQMLCYQWAVMFLPFTASTHLAHNVIANFSESIPRDRTACRKRRETSFDETMPSVLVSRIWKEGKKDCRVHGFRRDELPGTIGTRDTHSDDKGDFS